MHAYVNIFLKKMIFSVQNAILCIPPNFKQSRFTLLAPDIIHAVLAGKINKSISTEKLKQALPPMWEDQKKMFDIE